MNFVKFPVLAICFGLALSAHAADRRKKEEPPPPQFRADVATRPMSLAKLNNQVPVGSMIGKFCYSLICDRSQQVMSDYAFRGVPEQEFAELFTREAQAAAYNVAGTSTDLFASKDSAKPEIMVGAAITRFSADGEDHSLLGLGHNYTMDATMAVDWQVFDPLEKKIIYRGNSVGTARVSNAEGPQTLPREAARAAFREASKAILMEPNFLAAVKDPNGGPPANANDLFPEAQTEASSGLATQIPHLPLRTKTFQEQVDELRSQVVTVLTSAGSGSGFYIANNLLLTNNHVINGSKRVKIRFFGGREIPGEVVSSNAKRDIALLKTEGESFEGLALNTEKPEITSQTFVIGSPLGQENEGSISTGIISGFRDNEEGPMIQSDVGITHGNSGGPMFDAKGNVTGVAVQSLRDQYGTPTPVRLFIPIADALNALKIDLAPVAEASAKKSH